MVNPTTDEPKRVGETGKAEAGGRNSALMRERCVRYMAKGVQLLPPSLRQFALYLMEPARRRPHDARGLHSERFRVKLNRPRGPQMGNPNFLYWVAWWSRRKMIDARRDVVEAPTDAAHSS